MIRKYKKRKEDPKNWIKYKDNDNSIIINNSVPKLYNNK